jgi:hypothetical protein
MKIKELFESTKFITKKQIQQIYKECSPYFEEVGFDFNLYRGIKQDVFTSNARPNQIADSVYVMTVRKNRIPVDTPQPIHELVDNWMNKRFGEKFRSQSIFCTPYSIAARSYGDAYVILPIGNFSYLWSRKIADLFRELNKKIIEVGGDEISINRYGDFIYGTGRGVDDIPKETKQEIEKVLLSFDYTMENLTENLKNEVMIVCDNFYAIEKRLYESFIVEELKVIKERESKQ